MTAPAGAGQEAVQLRAFQQALIPESCPSCGHAEVASAFRPATGVVGGDFFDSVPLGGADAYFIGDVTGHGLSSSLVMAVIFGAAREALRTSRHPCEVIDHLHELLAELGSRAGGPRLFSATLFLGILDASGAFTYTNAGHPAPFLLRQGGEVDALSAVVPPLGFAAPTACFEETVELECGDRLLFYTDGVMDRDDSPEDVVQRLPDLKSTSPQAAVEALVTSGADDDRTAILVTLARQRSG